MENKTVVVNYSEEIRQLNYEIKRLTSIVDELKATVKRLEWDIRWDVTVGSQPTQTIGYQTLGEQKINWYDDKGTYAS
jgi:predicted RNase H-like nuclease (RuvC/YqgF family)